MSNVRSYRDTGEKHYKYISMKQHYNVYITEKEAWKLFLSEEEHGF